MTWKHLTFPQRKWRRKAGPISQEGPCDVRRDLFPQPPGERVPDSPPGERPSPAHPGSCGRQDPKQTFSSGPFPIANDKWESQKKKASRGGSLKKKKTELKSRFAVRRPCLPSAHPGTVRECKAVKAGLGRGRAPVLSSVPDGAVLQGRSLGGAGARPVR